jgi:hypothetical protein
MSKHYEWVGGERELPGKGKKKPGDKISEDSYSETDIKFYLEQGLIKTATPETKFTKPTKSKEIEITGGEK